MPILPRKQVPTKEQVDAVFRSQWWSNDELLSKKEKEARYLLLNCGTNPQGLSTEQIINNLFEDKLNNDFRKKN